MVLSHDKPQILKQNGVVGRKRTSPEPQTLLCCSLDWGRGFGSSSAEGLESVVGLILVAALGHGGMQVRMGLIHGAARGCTDSRGRFTAGEEWSAVPMPWIKQDADPSSLRAKHRGWAQHLRVVGAGIYPVFQQGVTWALRVTPPRRARGKFGGETPGTGGRGAPSALP